jgi:glutaredoxin
MINMEKERYLFVSSKCPKCEIVKAHMVDYRIDDVEIKNVTTDSDALALAAFLEVGMEVPVLYDDGKIVVGPDRIIEHLRDRA